MAAIPSEVWAQIASKSPATTLVAVYNTSIALRQRTAPLSTEMIAAVTTLDDFRAALGNGRYAQGGGRNASPLLAPELEGRPQLLAALGSRILALPGADRATATTEFLQVAQQHDAAASPLLQELVEAAQAGPQGLQAREDGLVGLRGAARREVMQGADLQEVVKKYAIASVSAINRLDTQVQVQQMKAPDLAAP